MRKYINIYGDPLAEEGVDWVSDEDIWYKAVRYTKEEYGKKQKKDEIDADRYEEYSEVDPEFLGDFM